MAGKRDSGRKRKFSVDGYFSGRRRKPEDEESVGAILEREREEMRAAGRARDRKRGRGMDEEDEEGDDEEPYAEEELDEEYGRGEEEEEEYGEDDEEEQYARRGRRVPRRKGKAGRERKLVKSTPLIFVSYAIVSAAISFGLTVMAFVLAKRLPSVATQIPGVPQAPGTLWEYLVSNIVFSGIIFVALFAVQSAYFLGYRLLEKREREYERREVAYSIVFAIATLAAALAVLWALGL
jgi:hypothetical protein